MANPAVADETTQLHENICTFVRLFMALRNMNQREVAAKTGIEQAVISARMRGITHWKVEDILSLARAFDVHPGVFFGDPKGFTPQLGDVPYVPLITDHKRRSRGQRSQINRCSPEVAA